ncbi:hypothetical protein ABWL39_10110 [Chitinivorax sp. PXF-14]|uniref:hypothetical protein n=1 Tax=Chitinivorax sp. PXF-14 TaxID=3230488 RepID=UPI0034671FAA
MSFLPKQVSHLFKRPAISLLIKIALAITVTVWLYSNLRGVSLTDGWMFHEAKRGPVIGDLGGVPVSIPEPYAHFVEYNGDPQFMEPRNGPIPERTYQSKLRSFGFEIRFPDMAPLTPQTEADKRAHSIFNTTWIRVRVGSGEHGAKAGYLERYLATIKAPDTYRPPYIDVPEKIYGLTSLTPKLANTSGGQNDMPDELYEDVFYHLNKDGQIDTFIKCSNVRHAAAPCTQTFSLEPYMHEATVNVSYRRGLLNEWMLIQSSVTNVISQFSIN